MPTPKHKSCKERPLVRVLSQKEILVPFLSFCRSFFCGDPLCLHALPSWNVFDFLTVIDWSTIDVLTPWSSNTQGSVKCLQRTTVWSQTHSVRHQFMPDHCYWQINNWWTHTLVLQYSGLSEMSPTNNCKISNTQCQAPIRQRHSMAWHLPHRHNNSAISYRTLWTIFGWWRPAKTQSA